MNILLDLKHFSLNNIFHCDTKENIIMEGKFTKLLYSNELFTMNGIYFSFPIEEIAIEKVGNRNLIKFHSYSQVNLPIIQEFAKIEYRILEHYKYMNKCARKISNTLSKQLYLGSMKIYNDLHSFTQVKSSNVNGYKNYDNMNENHSNFFLKISGIWETDNEIGLTYKLHRT
jgi:hypothetical protein